MQGKCFGEIGRTLYTAHLVSPLKMKGDRNIGRGSHLTDIEGLHLQDMACKAAGKVQPLQHAHPCLVKMSVMIFTLKLIYKVVEIEFSLPLPLNIGPVGEPCRVTTAFPILYLKRRTFSISHIPAIERHIRTQFKGCWLPSKMIVEAMSDNFVLTWFTPLCIEAPASLPITVFGRYGGHASL